MHTIDIPGGQATFYDQDEITPRRLRPIQEATLRMGHLMTAVMQARSVGGEDARPELPGASLPDMNADEAHLFVGLQDLAVWAFLKSWTLPDPVPDTPDGLQDLPMGLYAALAAEGSRLFSASDSFQVGQQTVGDRSSPTGASAG